MEEYLGGSCLSILSLAFLTVVVICLPAFGEMNPNLPNRPVRLVFIHHSTGENWLADEDGGLGIALTDNNYFVSDTNYGWGPDSIGDTTDIGNWWTWFRGPRSATYMTALYAESQQNASYSRLSASPGRENEIVMFKSCFPNSALKGSPDDPVPAISDNPLRGQDSGSDYHTVANAKGIYIDLLEYFRTRPDKLFVVITAPPLSDPSYAANARAFNQWLVYEWLRNYPYHNIAVFDFYNVLTTNGGDANSNDFNQAAGNHHRWWNGSIQHKSDVPSDTAAYASALDNDHPTRAGNLKATGEFLPLLNIYYNCWKGVGDCPLIGGNRCAALLADDLSLHIPVITYNGSSYWADLSYVPDTVAFTLINGGGVADTNPFVGCPPSTLSNDFTLHIPNVVFNGASYWLDMTYDEGATFSATAFGRAQ